MSATEQSLAETRLGAWGWATFLQTDFIAVTCLVASAGAFYLAPWPALYVPAFALLAIVTWQRLDLALLLIPLFAPFWFAPRHVGPKEFAPSELFLVLDAAVAVAYALVPARRGTLNWQRIRRSPFRWPAALFLAAALLSTLFAADHHQALQELREVILEPLLFFALLLLLLSDLSQWRWIFAALVAAGLVVGAIALIQFGTHQNLTTVPGTSIERVRALYGSADNLGLFYDRVIPVWFAVTVLARFPRRWRVALWAVGVILGVTLFLTYSRGAWLGVALGCLLVLALARPWGRWLAFAALLMVAVGVAMGGPHVVSALKFGHEGTVQRRVDVWDSALQMLQEHPIFGVGPDNFLHYYAPPHDPYMPCKPGLGYVKPAAIAEPCLSHPHNEILDFWLSTGLLGLVAFFWLQFVFWRTGFALWRQFSRCPVPLLGGVLGAMFAGLVHGFVDQSYFLIDLAVLFWLFAAFVSYLSLRHGTTGRWQLSR